MNGYLQYQGSALWCEPWNRLKRENAKFCAFCWHGRLNSKRRGKKKKTSTSWSVSPWQLLHLLRVTDSGGFNVCERNQHETKVLKDNYGNHKMPSVPKRRAGIGREFNHNLMRENYSPVGRSSRGGGYLTLKLRSLRCPSPHRYALFFFLLSVHTGWRARSARRSLEL